MKKLYISVGVFIIAAGAFVATWRQTPTAGPSALPLENVNIVLGEKGFEPSEVTLKKGSIVTFSATLGKPFWPASDPHPSHTLYGEFDPHLPIAPDRTWQMTFDEVGTWRFHDHLRSYFTGTIYVVE